MENEADRIKLFYMDKIIEESDDIHDNLAKFGRGTDVNPFIIVFTSYHLLNNINKARGVSGSRKVLMHADVTFKLHVNGYKTLGN